MSKKIAAIFCVTILSTIGTLPVISQENLFEEDTTDSEIEKYSSLHAAAQFSICIIWSDATVDMQSFNPPEYWFGGTFNIGLIGTGPIIISADFGTRMKGYYKVDITCGDRNIDGEKHNFDVYWKPGTDEVSYYKEYEEVGHWKFPPWYPANMHAHVTAYWDRYEYDFDEGEWKEAWPPFQQESDSLMGYMQNSKSRDKTSSSLLINQIMQNRNFLEIFQFLFN